MVKGSRRGVFFLLSRSAAVGMGYHVCIGPDAGEGRDLVSGEGW